MLKLTKYDKNILAYRLLVVGQMRLMEKNHYNVVSKFEDTRESLMEKLGEITRGDLTGAVLVWYKELEGVKVTGVSCSNYIGDSAILKVKVVVEEDPENEYELEYMVNVKESRLLVIEED